MLFLFVLQIYLISTIYCDLDGGRRKCIKLCENSTSINEDGHLRPQYVPFRECAHGCYHYLQQEQEHNNSDAETVLEMCKSVCPGFYSDSNQEMIGHCRTGCQIQYNVTTEEKNETEVSMHMVAPLFSIRSLRFIGDSLNNAIKAVQTTWSYYMADTGDVIAMKSSAEYVIVAADEPKSQGFPGEKQPQTNEYSNEMDLDNYKSDDSQINRRFLRTDWLGCVSKKSGLPRSFIAFSILLSIVAIIWLCLSTFASAPDKNQTTEVNLKGTLPAYVDINENSEKVKIQPSFDDQAPLLPVKISLTNV